MRPPCSYLYIYIIIHIEKLSNFLNLPPSLSLTPHVYNAIITRRVFASDVLHYHSGYLFLFNFHVHVVGKGKGVCIGTHSITLIPESGT